MAFGLKVHGIGINCTCKHFCKTSLHFTPCGMHKAVSLNTGVVNFHSLFSKRITPRSIKVVYAGGQYFFLMWSIQRFNCTAMPCSNYCGRLHPVSDENNCS